MQQYRNLFQNWLGQLVERVIRLDQYLSERAASAPHRLTTGPNIVADLVESLDYLAEDLLKKAAYFLKGESSVEDHRSRYYAFARSAADQFRRLHAVVTYIPGPWPSPELELFLRKVLEEGGFKLAGDDSTPIPWTILLSGDYNFSHILIPRTVPNVLAGHSPFRNLLTVPSAEKDNPLMWPNLLHEIAHVIGEEKGIIEAAQARLSRIEATPQSRKIMEEWTHEIVADLIATDYLGLAYFGAFVNFATYWVPFSLRKPTASHPASSNRVNYLFRHLKGSSPASIRDALETLQADYNARHELDQEDFAVRHDLFDTLRDINSPDKPFPSDEELASYISEIVDLNEYKSVRPRSAWFSEGDASRIIELAKRLKEGQLISSYRDCSILGSTFSLEEDVRKNYRVAVSQLKELPNEVRHILNAALIRRLSHAETIAFDPNKPIVVGFYGRLLHDFCESRAPTMRKRLIDLRQTVNNLDSVISKSMEATAVMAFYQAGIPPT